MKILVAEPLAEAGIELLKSQPGWDVAVSTPEEYQKYLAGADALIVRSAVCVDAGVLAKGQKLKVVGRAGVGAENVDVEAATAAGVLVMNTPGGNAVSVAEHTLGLMLSMARQIPQAIASVKSGSWDAKKFLGSELRGKTLGVIGLGSIGREVVRRARGFEMKIVASDPYVNSRTAADLNTTLLSLPELYAEADYITLHVALTTETYGMLNDAAFARMKKGVRIVNCARGELIDGEALRKAIQSGEVAGAALDVFQTEPPVSEPLLAFENVLATPHIGGFTLEAQDALGYRIAEQVVEYLREGVVLNAVNIPALTAEQYRTVGPYAALAERLGTFAAYVASGNPRLVRLVYKGRISEQNTSLIRNAGLAGVTCVEGSIVFDRPRLLRVDGIHCEAPLTGHLMFLKNADVPGVIGYVGSITGKNNINIASFSLGREERNGKNGELQAVAVVETDGPVPDAVLKQILENKSVTLARSVELQA